jgi:hypothetical protein
MLAGSAAADPGLTDPDPRGGPCFVLPIACRPGIDCFVQNYVDHDPGPAARDGFGGARTYDGHDGTDIRLPTMTAARAGVAVLAAAAGVVRATRDGVPDDGRADAAAIAGRECGNGVVITHTGDWQTQYCHLARGSIGVTQGQNVLPGQPIGRVGLSGNTEFPHLHFTARFRNAPVDPFGRLAPGIPACGSAGAWAPAVARAFPPPGRVVLNIGFARGPVDSAAIDAGTIDAGTIAAPDGRSPTILVFFVRLIGLEAGDHVDLSLRGPDGAVIAESSSLPLDRAKAQWVAFAGRRRTAAGWPKGRYVGAVRAGRDGSWIERSADVVVQ